MNTVKSTLVVVVTLLGLVLLIPLFPFLILIFGKDIAIGFGIGAAGALLAFLYAVIKVTSENAERRNRIAEAEAQKAKRKSEYLQKITGMGFATEKDFEFAGGLRDERWRALYAQSRGYKTWQDYATFFKAQRAAGISIEAILNSGPTWREINEIYAAERKAAIIAKIADTESQSH